MAPHDLVITLVRDYLETSTRYARRLHAQAGPEGILGTFHRGALPRRGIFRGVPRAGYELHGSGCRVRSRGLEISWHVTELTYRIRPRFEGRNRHCGNSR